MKIRVDEYHIKNGACRSLEGCPVALAVTPRLPAGKFAIVLEDSIIVRQRSLPISQRIAQQLEVKLPIEVTAWIMRYDETEKAEPFEFEISL